MEEKHIISLPNISPPPPCDMSASHVIMFQGNMIKLLQSKKVTLKIACLSLLAHFFSQSNVFGLQEKECFSL